MGWWCETLPFLLEVGWTTDISASATEQNGTGHCLQPSWRKRWFVAFTFSVSAPGKCGRRIFGIAVV
jgi:hypothetical protein